MFVAGAKFSQTSEGTRIIEQDGTSLTVESAAGVEHLAVSTQQIWQYSQQVRLRNITKVSTLPGKLCKHGILSYSFPGLQNACNLLLK